MDVPTAPYRAHLAQSSLCGNEEWICSSEVELFRCFGSSTRTTTPPVLASMTAVTSALMMLQALGQRVPFVYGPGASLPKVMTLLRHMHVAGDRAIQVEEVVFVYCNEETTVLNATRAEANVIIEALVALFAAQNKKIQAMIDDIAAFQCKVVSDSATLQNEREMCAKEHADLTLLRRKEF